MNLEQLKTILWLRWRLTRNQWARSKGVGGAIATVVIILLFLLALASFVGALLLGMFGLGTAKPLALTAVWAGLTLAFLFSWMIGLLNELQRSETIDLQRLMHLPVALGQIFIVNYIASHLSLSIFFAVPAMMGLTLGLALSRGPEMLLLAPLSLSVVLMVSAWTYLLRGWLATLMSNPRRRRTVIMVITFSFILISQAPNFYFNVLHSRSRSSSPAAMRARRGNSQNPFSREKLDTLITFQKFIPPFWLSFGAGELADARPWPAVLGTFGCLAIGALGLRRSYRNTLRFYHGETGKKSKAPLDPDPVKTLTPAKVENRFLEFRIPALPEQSVALALATFRSMLRAPEVKMAWASSFLVPLIVGASFLLRGPSHTPDSAKPFMATGAVVFAVFMLVQFLSNQFGFDRDGFRALILAPADRRLILLGKNLASLPVAAGFGLVLLALICLWLRPSIPIVAATLFQLPSVVLMAGLVGNLLSVLVPYRMQPGSMKPTKMPALPMLVMVFCHLLFPVAMAPVFVAPLAELLWRQAGWPEVVPVNLLFSFAFAALVTFVYWVTLGPIGRLLQRRETKILNAVSAEVE